MNIEISECDVDFVLDHYDMNELARSILVISRLVGVNMIHVDDPTELVLYDVSREVNTLCAKLQEARELIADHIVVVGPVMVCIECENPLENHHEGCRLAAVLEETSDA